MFVVLIKRNYTTAGAGLVEHRAFMTEDGGETYFERACRFDTREDALTAKHMLGVKGGVVLTEDEARAEMGFVAKVKAGAAYATKVLTPGAETVVVGEYGSKMQAIAKANLRAIETPAGAYVLVVNFKGVVEYAVEGKVAPTVVTVIGV